MIVTGGEGEEGEKVNLKICLAGELNPGLQCERRHTAGLDTIFVQSYMDTLPGVPGVSKNQNFFYK